MAKYGDIQVGSPMVDYSDSQANIEALTGISAGATAYATDLEKHGSFNGFVWTWLGAGGGDVETVTGDGVDNTDPLNPVISYPTPADIGAVPATRQVNGHALSADVTVTKGDVGLGNADNTSDVNKPVSTAQAAADATVLSTAESYADGLVVGLWDDRGNYDASGGAYPSSGGSGSAGAILKGDTWTISVAGTLPTSQPVEIGDVVRALANTPGNTQANWAIQQNNISLPVSPANGGTGNNNSVGLLLTTNQGTLSFGASSKTLTVSDNATVSGTNTGDVTIGTFGSTPNANGLSVSSQIIIMQPADGTHPGGLSTGTQSIAGDKTFSGKLSVFSGGSGNTQFVAGAASNGSNVSISDSTINCWVGSNTDSLPLYVNRTGYNGGTTRFRDFFIQDGKGNTILYTEGATSRVYIGPDASPSPAYTLDVEGTFGVTGHVTLEGATSTGATGTGKLVFATSPALVTPALGVATATSLQIASGDTLDVVNSGTFTPVIIGLTTAGAGTYSTQVGVSYTIGKFVHYEIDLTWSAHTGTGNMRVDGLPYTTANNGISAAGAVTWNNITLLAIGNKIIAATIANSTQIGLQEIGSGAASAIPMDTAGSLRVSGCFIRA